LYRRFGHRRHTGGEKYVRRQQVEGIPIDGRKKYVENRETQIPMYKYHNPKKMKKKIYKIVEFNNDEIILLAPTQVEISCAPRK
jgi:hypothetical protein